MGLLFDLSFPAMLYEACSFSPLGCATPPCLNWGGQARDTPTQVSVFVGASLKSLVAMVGLKFVFSLGREFLPVNFPLCFFHVFRTPKSF